MDKDKKKIYLDLLEVDPMYSAMLDLVSKEDEKRKIKAYTQEVYITLLEAFLKASNIEDNDT